MKRKGVKEQLSDDLALQYPRMKAWFVRNRRSMVLLFILWMILRVFADFDRS